MELDRGQLYILAGLVLLLGSVGVGYEMWDVEYTHYLVSDDADFNASSEGYLQYSNLSDRGKEVVDRTIKRDKYVVDSETKTAPDFEYGTDHSSLGYGHYVVQRDGTNYSIRMYEGGPTFATPLFTVVLLIPLGLLGSGLCVKGIRHG